MKTQAKIAITTGVLIIGGLALASVGIAHGGHGQKGGKRFGGPMLMWMEKADANGDEKVTEAEIDEAIRGQIAAADTDGDGRLSLDEFQPVLVEIMRPRIVDAFQFLDADGDAGITLEEIDQPTSRLMSRLDRNEDGELTTDELKRRHRGGRHGHGGRERHDNDDN